MMESQSGKWVWEDELKLKDEDFKCHVKDYILYSIGNREVLTVFEQM